MRASELPAITLRAGPIHLAERHRLWGRSLAGSAPIFGGSQPDLPPPAVTPGAPLPGTRRLRVG